MNKEQEEKALKALERQKKQYQRQNEYIRNNYERVSVTFPKGTKERITGTGSSVNGFIQKAVFDKLDSIYKKKGGQNEP